MTRKETERLNEKINDLDFKFNSMDKYLKLRGLDFFITEESKEINIIIAEIRRFVNGQ